MEITTRAFNKEDLDYCIDIEANAMPRNRYIADVAEFFGQTKGDLTLGIIDGKPVGMGKLTILFDGSAWLELLRVHPDFQRKGVAAAIYVRYMQQVKDYNCPALRMYTGVKNVASATLAEKNGMHRACEFRGMSLEMDKAEERDGGKMALCANMEQAKKLLEPLREKTGGYLNINHTFYAMNDATYSGFASNGWVYGGEDATIVMGSRFQAQKCLYIAAIGGDKQKALDYAIMDAKRRGVAKITAHFAPSDSETQAFYEENGFTLDPSDDVVMECIY